MFDVSQIKEHAEIISADGLHIGTVDRVEGNRIKLTKKDSGAGHEDHHHFIDIDLVESVDDNRVRLTARSADVISSEEEESGFFGSLNGITVYSRIAQGRTNG